jgi:DNA-binding response OmpR family regulator
MQTMKDILILEDDRKISALLTDSLKNSFTVHRAYRIYEARQILKRIHIDILCLDLILPDGNGIDFCREVKIDFPETKVIVLTKKINLDTRLDSFKIGAEDYLPKPFFPQELVARINRLFEKAEVLGYKGLKINAETNSITYDNSMVILSRNEYLIMEYLIRSKGIKSLESICKYVSTKKNKETSNDSLIVGMTRLRKKFERNLGMKIVKTRYGKGYYIGL